jgi:hypothetical protein
MRGASLRSVAELLGHQSMKMTMRYAHLSPAFLAAEVSLLDPPPEKPKTAASAKIDRASRDRAKANKARKRQLYSRRTESQSEIPKFVQDFGSSGWARTSSPPVNRKMQVGYRVASSWV